jgi:hypothetical protein
VSPKQQLAALQSAPTPAQQEPLPQVPVQHWVPASHDTPFSVQQTAEGPQNWEQQSESKLLGVVHGDCVGEHAPHLNVELRHCNPSQHWNDPSNRRRWRRSTHLRRCNRRCSSPGR